MRKDRDGLRVGPSGDMGLYYLAGAGSAVAKDDVAFVCLEEGRCLGQLSRAGATVCMHDAKQALVEHCGGAWMSAQG
jgi:hypothetical protein